MHHLLSFQYVEFVNKENNACMSGYLLLPQGESVLKVQYLTDKTPWSGVDPGPTDQELMKMFTTSKHEWKYT